MDARQAIRCCIDSGNSISQGYLGDLSDAELLVRPVPGINHIAWQLGHLIASEHDMVEACFPGTMPPLPAGFKEKYTPETSRLDDPAAFHTKKELLEVLEQQRSGTLKALEKVSDVDLDKPVPDSMSAYLNNVGDMFSMQGTHWVMHAGQWAVVRRKLGRAPLF